MGIRFWLVCRSASACSTAGVGSEGDLQDRRCAAGGCARPRNLAACKDGVRRASLDFQSDGAERLTHYTTADGLLQNEAFAEQAFSGRIFIAGKTGLWSSTAFNGCPLNCLIFPCLIYAMARQVAGGHWGGIWVRMPPAFGAGWRIGSIAQRASVDQNQAIWLAMPEIDWAIISKARANGRSSRRTARRTTNTAPWLSIRMDTSGRRRPAQASPAMTANSGALFP